MVVSPLPVAATPDDVSDYHIEAQTSLVERALRTLKHGDAFAVLDPYGDIGIAENTAEGLFFRDMRHLSRLQLRCSGHRPLLLSSVMQDDNAALAVDLTNPDIEFPDADKIQRDTIALERFKFLWNDACYERIALRNFGVQTCRMDVSLSFEADFKDLFEVRGVDRLRRGEVTASVVSDQDVELQYRGLDGTTRLTRLSFHPKPKRLDVRRAVFDVTLPAGAQSSIALTISLDAQQPRERAVGLLQAYRNKRRDMRALSNGLTTVSTSNGLLNEILCQCTSDLHMLLTDTPTGRYPYAGIPWYSTVFGRDGIITAMLMLWLDPSIARGVLTHLAAMQATDFDSAADAQPGKILHERRQGEMAMLGEVPFRRYYGTVDATPLFVMLAGMYFERTADRATIAAIWTNIKAALKWIDTFGDRDGDGFVEYFRETPQGLANQGWKDSHDSIFHSDGSTAEGPIALVEVQAYVYAAKQKAATLATLFDDPDLATRLTADAARLREKFDHAFWSDEIGTYALALDGDKRACRVRTSNAGHALMTGIALPHRAASVASRLLSTDGSSGWGVRTLSQGEPRYNPMSYHNGSIWPHDNAIVALGLSRYGLRREAADVFAAIYGANLYQDDRRLPELFCGFPRKPRRGPTSYPVACSPQAWAAATPFALLAACLGIEVDCEREILSFTDPTFPPFFDKLDLRNMAVGNSRCDIQLSATHSGSVAVEVLRCTGDAQIVMRSRRLSDGKSL